MENNQINVFENEGTEIIKIDYSNPDAPAVSGRELHKALGIKTAYKDWFPRMCEYGFTEGKDFCSNLSESTGGRPSINHTLSFDMAKEICMIQRTPKGKEFREYFIAVERAWNDPLAIMSRALEAQRNITAKLGSQLALLENTVAVQEVQIAEMKPKASYYDVVLNCKDLLSVTEIAKDYGKSAVWLNKWLHEHGIQFKQGGMWLLYQKYAEQGYTSTKTQTYNGSDGEVHTKVHTYWTQKGRLFLYEQLKADGVLPNIEKEN